MSGKGQPGGRSGGQGGAGRSGNGQPGRGQAGRSQPGRPGKAQPGKGQAGKGQAGKSQGGKGQAGGGQPGRRQAGAAASGGGPRRATSAGRPPRPGRRPEPSARRTAEAPQPAAPPRPEPVDVHQADGVRLQKVLAQAGLGSRRACEELILAGRVEVDGQPVVELGVRIDPRGQRVHVDGVRLQLDQDLVYVALNKPRGVVSTMSDPEGRPCLTDLLGNRAERLFHVGRLDTDTEGLILLTNDGELSQRLAHPRYRVPKTYLVEVAGQVPKDLGRRLREGVELEDGLASVDSFRVIDARPGKALLELVLHDGRNRVVRRMLASVGHPVEQLVRTRVGPIRLGDLPTGRSRVLNRGEVGSLFTAVGL